MSIEMKKSMLFWGATGQSKVLWDILQPEFQLVALIDRNPNLKSSISGVPLYAKIEDFMAGYAGDLLELHFMSTVAGVFSGRDRCILHELLKGLGMHPQSAVHPSAVVSKSSKIGEGAQLLANSAVCANANLGNCCIVNTAASVDHDAVLADGVHVCPGAHVLGEVKIDPYATIGAGAIILSRLHIGEGVVVGAGSVVIHDVPSNCVVAGNPAKVIRWL